MAQLLRGLYAQSFHSRDSKRIMNDVKDAVFITSNSTRSQQQDYFVLF